MSDDFKEWVCIKAGTEYEYYDGSMPPNAVNCTREIDEGILIKCMWSINREGEKWDIMINLNCVYVDHEIYFDLTKRFNFRDNNNSEIEALHKALIYIWEKENGK